jgi:predicted nucleotidyltransferase component of viral defense system
MNEGSKNQVRLLLAVLPEVAKETCFAMHGGTAINLFLRDMPRLSVDIDLTYVEISRVMRRFGPSMRVWCELRKA